MPAAPLPSCLRRRRDRSRPCPPVTDSGTLYLRLPARHIALFRFLLEAWENLAYFTVLDRREALIKVIFSPHMAEEVDLALADMGRALTLQRLPAPPHRRLPHAPQENLPASAPGQHPPLS